MSSKDPKEKFKKFVGAESGGGRPKGKGYITELQRQKLKPAHLEVIVQNNKERVDIRGRFRLDISLYYTTVIFFPSEFYHTPTSQV